MSKVLKNLMEKSPAIASSFDNEKKPAISSQKDATLATILSCLRRESPTGRESQRVSSEFRKRNNGNCLTPISRSRKNTPFEEKKRSLSPKTPYLSIREYLEGRNKTPNARNKQETPGKARGSQGNAEKNVAKSQKNLFEITEKKEKSRKNGDDLKITIKDENFQEKNRESLNKHEFLVNVNINIANKLDHRAEKSAENRSFAKNFAKNCNNFMKIKENNSILSDKAKDLANFSKKMNIAQENSGKVKELCKTSENFFENSKRNVTPLRKRDEILTKPEKMVKPQTKLEIIPLKEQPTLVKPIKL